MQLRMALRLILAAWALPVFCLPARAQAQEIRAPRVVTPPSMMIEAPDGLKTLFPQGFSPGLGFGLSFAQEQADGSMVLHTLTGRGPTLPGPMVPMAASGGGSQNPPAAPAAPAALATPAPSAPSASQAPSTIFILPDYNPSIVTLKLTGRTAEVIGQLPLRDEDGQPLRGLPPEPEAPGGQPEIPLDLALGRLGYDGRGLDPQGVAYDFKHGVYWLADNYRPALVSISPRDGRVLNMYAPGAGLEEYLGARRAGRGFMDVSVSPVGKVYTIMGGVLSVDGKPAIFSRIIELDPDTERVRQLPYPIDDETFADPAQVSTGEVVAFADKRLLVLEQGLDKQGRPRSLVYAVDLSRASNINYVHNEAGQPPEVLTDKVKLMKNIQLPVKTLVLDLHQAGFKEDTAESMALLSDGRTLAIMGGHGFGLEERIAGCAKDAQGKPALDPRSYRLEPGGTLGFDGQPTKASIRVAPTREAPRLWLVTLPKKVTEY